MCKHYLEHYDYTVCIHIWSTQKKKTPPTPPSNKQTTITVLFPRTKPRPFGKNDSWIALSKPHHARYAYYRRARGRAQRGYFRRVAGPFPRDCTFIFQRGAGLLLETIAQRRCFFSLSLSSIPPTHSRNRPIEHQAVFASGSVRHASAIDWFWFQVFRMKIVLYLCNNRQVDCTLDRRGCGARACERSFASSRKCLENVLIDNQVVFISLINLSSERRRKCFWCW